VGALWSALKGVGFARVKSLEPLSEALLFGIGGGIGLGYFVYESGDYTSLYLATRLVTNENPESGFLMTICTRLGVEVRQQSTSSALLAEKKLQASLETGSPVLVYVDPRRLPYPGLPAVYQTVLVYAYDASQGTYQVIDRCREPLTLTSEELSTARTGEGAPRFRSLEIVGGGPIARDALRDAISAGLAAGLMQLREGFGPANFRSNFGLQGLEKWAALLINPKDKRGWPKFFSPGKRLFEALLSAYHQIEQRGSPAALRPLYAHFLEEAGELTENPKLVEAAGLARASAETWSQLSAALLPESIPLLAEARRLVERRLDQFYEQGRSAGDEMAQSLVNLEALRTAASSNFPLSLEETGEFLDALRQRVLAVLQAEQDLVLAVERSFPAG
jgi:Butirosin biosynthesis protein H, N-terminal/Domain of unknown function (DUF4872)